MYVVCSLVGWLVSYIYIYFHIDEHYFRRRIHKILEVALVISLIGARCLWVLIQVCKEKRLPYILDFMNGGLVFYGGLLLVLLWIYLYFLYIEKEDYLDLFVITIPLFHSFARIGCYFAGCCYGKNGIPIQIIESTICLFIFVILNHLKNKQAYEKRICGIYLFLYAISRFIIEFFRADIERGIWFGGMSTSQYISIFIIIFIVLKCKIRRKMSKWNNY